MHSSQYVRPPMKTIVKSDAVYQEEYDLEGWTLEVREFKYRQDGQLWYVNVMTGFSYDDDGWPVSGIWNVYAPGEQLHSSCPLMYKNGEFLRDGLGISTDGRVTEYKEGKKMCSWQSALPVVEHEGVLKLMSANQAMSYKKKYDWGQHITQVPVARPASKKHSC